MTMFHYTEVSQTVIDNLIGLDEMLGCTENSSSSYKTLDDDLMPTEIVSECQMGHTDMEHIDPDLKKSAIDYMDTILEPIIGYKPQTHGRYGYYRQPIHVHNDGQNMLGSNEVWSKHNLTGIRPKPANTTVFFPLRIFGSDGKEGSGSTATIYFDQRTPTQSQSGKRASTPLEEFYRKHGAYGWDKKHDYSDLDGWTGKSFDTEIHEKYLKQNPIEKLFGFSFAGEVPWNIGEVVMFETSRLHCSSYMEDCIRKDCFLVKVNTNLWD